MPSPMTATDDMPPLTQEERLERIEALLMGAVCMLITPCDANERLMRRLLQTVLEHNNEIWINAHAKEAPPRGNRRTK